MEKGKINTGSGRSLSRNRSAREGSSAASHRGGAASGRDNLLEHVALKEVAHLYGHRTRRSASSRQFLGCV